MICQGNLSGGPGVTAERLKFSWAGFGYLFSVVSSRLVRLMAGAPGTEVAGLFSIVPPELNGVCACKGREGGVEFVHNGQGRRNRSTGTTGRAHQQ